MQHMHVLGAPKDTPEEYTKERAKDPKYKAVVRNLADPKLIEGLVMWGEHEERLREKEKEKESPGVEDAGSEGKTDEVKNEAGADVKAEPAGDVKMEVEETGPAPDVKVAEAVNSEQPMDQDPPPAAT